MLVFVASLTRSTLSTLNPVVATPSSLKLKVSSQLSDKTFGYLHIFSVKSELSLGGQKPLWISSQSLGEDKEELLPVLKEVTNDYSNDVIWTCSPASDFGKCKPFCKEGWVYANINHMDGIEAACVVIFGIPPKDNIFSLTNLSRLFTRARNCLIIITEENVPRYD